MPLIRLQKYLFKCTPGFKYFPVAVYKKARVLALSPCVQ